MTYDVAIVGAGPSGSRAAALLAARGARVALVDASHPREKPCGGGITGRAVALIDDPEIWTHVGVVRARTARFMDGRRRESPAVALDPTAQALLIASRTEFDGRLYERAAASGATLVRERVLDVRRDGGRFTVATADGGAITASFVVGADGANSLVRRRMSRAFRRDQLSIATGFFAHGVTSDEIVIELTANPPGYIWSFPRPTHLAIGICAQADSGASSSALRARVAEWIARTRIAEGARLEPYAWPIPSLSATDCQRVPIAGPGWLTLGDAAGLVDPITREGIFFALQSAALAVDALSTATQPDLRFTEHVRAEIGAELARAARYKAGFFHPRFTALLLEALAASARVRGVMADLVAGTQPYRTLKWRLAKTFEFGLAWRLLTDRHAV